MSELIEAARGGWASGHLRGIAGVWGFGLLGFVILALSLKKWSNR